MEKLDGIPVELYKRVGTCHTRHSTRSVTRNVTRKRCQKISLGRAYTRRDPQTTPLSTGAQACSHTHKVFVQCLQECLPGNKTQQYLSDWQAGVHKLCGCRDNVLIPRTIFDVMLERGEKLFSTFIDDSAVFDTVSHKFLDRTLKRTNTPRPESHHKHQENSRLK